MIEENNIESVEEQEIVDVREKPILDLTELSNEDLMEFYSKIDEQLKYLTNNIIVEEEEQNE